MPNAIARAFAVVVAVSSSACYSTTPLQPEDVATVSRAGTAEGWLHGPDGERAIVGPDDEVTVRRVDGAGERTLQRPYRAWIRGTELVVADSATGVATTYSLDRRVTTAGVEQPDDTADTVAAIFAIGGAVMAIGMVVALVVVANTLDDSSSGGSFEIECSGFPAYC